MGNMNIIHDIDLLIESLFFRNIIKPYITNK